MENSKAKEKINFKNNNYKIRNRTKENYNSNDDKKNKGYARIFRKIIKKNNNILKNIINNRFKKWQKEAFKGTYIRKTIVVRISVSRDKILKNRNVSNPLLSKEKIKGIRPNSEDKNIKHKNKNDNRKNNMINNIQWKNDYQLKTPERSKEKNNIYSNEKMNKNGKNSLITISDYKKNDKAQDNTNKKNNTYNPSNLSNITSSNGLNKNPYNKPKINNIQNNNNKKTASNIYTYELNKPLLNPKDIFSRYDNKTANQKNIINNNNTKMKNKDYKNYRAYTNVNSPNTIHRKNNSKYSLKSNEKEKLNSTKDSYMDYKHTPLKSYLSETKIFKDKSYFKNTYTKSNHHKNPSFDNEYKYKYETRTSKKDAYLKKKIDNEILKKGITTVIQHYLGVREKLDNYGLKKNLPN